MKMKIITVTLKPKTKKQIEDKARELAYDSSEEAWDGLFWSTGLEVSVAIRKVMQTLAKGGDYTAAITVLKGLYDLAGWELPPEVATYKKCPDLLKLFVDEFLLESGEYLAECIDRLNKGYVDTDDFST